MSQRYHPKKIELTPQDRQDTEAVMRDRFQSTRARSRAQALLLCADREPDSVIFGLTGLSAPLLLAMLNRLKSHGLRGALFGVESEKRRYDVNAVADELRKTIAMRPPEGVYWTIQALAEKVRTCVAGAENISGEYVRQVMVRKLGIRSVRHIEPYWLSQARKKTSLVEIAQSVENGVDRPASSSSDDGTVADA